MPLADSDRFQEDIIGRGCTKETRLYVLPRKLKCHRLAVASVRRLTNFGLLGRMFILMILFCSGRAGVLE